MANDLDKVLIRWEFYTLKADRSYHAGELNQAAKEFAKTVELLEPWLWNDPRSKSRIVRFFVLACHNTAHVMSKLGREREAEYYLSHAHFSLLGLLGAAQRPSSKHLPNLIRIVLIELKLTLNQLSGHLKSRNKLALCESIQEESERVIRQSCGMGSLEVLDA